MAEHDEHHDHEEENSKEAATPIPKVSILDLVSVQPLEKKLRDKSLRRKSWQISMQAVGDSDGGSEETPMADEGKAAESPKNPLGESRLPSYRPV